MRDRGVGDGWWSPQESDLMSVVDLGHSSRFNCAKINSKDCALCVLAIVRGEFTDMEAMSVTPILKELKRKGSHVTCAIPAV